MQPAVLNFIKSFEIEYGSTDEAVFNFLKARAHAKQTPQTMSDLEEKLETISQDKDAESSVDKIQSLLLSLEKVLLELGMSEHQCDGTLCVPLQTQIDVVLSKLPATLKRQVQKKMRCMPTIVSKKVLMQLLSDEAKDFNWPRTRSKN